MVNIGFIGGSGLHKGLEGMLDDVRMEEDIHNDMGNVCVLYEGRVGNVRVVIIPRHGRVLPNGRPERSPAELDQGGNRAHIREFQTRGVMSIFGFSAVGAMDLETPYVTQRAVVVPEWCGWGFRTTPQSFGSMARVVHPAMYKSGFSPSLRTRIFRAAAEEDVQALNGFYIYSGGNAFESAAEIEAYKGWFPNRQHRVVGMTTVPELFLTKEMGFRYACVASNVNYAAGVKRGEKVTHEQTMVRIHDAERMLVGIARGIIAGYVR